MKTLIYFPFFCLLFLSEQTFAQIPAIDSLKIIPINPSTEHEIKVICYTTFPSGDCELINHSFSTENTTITLNLNFMVGAATYICHSTDTLSIGNLSSGNYNLDVNLTIDPEEVIVNHKTIAFYISESLSITKTLDNRDFSIYPNPFQNELFIETNNGIEQVEMFSIFGQKVLSEGIVSYYKTINVSNLEDGIYLVLLTDLKGNKYSKKVLKTKL